MRWRASGAVRSHVLQSTPSGQGRSWQVTQARALVLRQPKRSAVRFLDRYPVVITPKLRECRDFWTRHLRFSVAFEATWFVLLQAEGESATIAFMSPDHPSTPPGS